jgi:hypothetical protein
MVNDVEVDGDHLELGRNVGSSSLMSRVEFGMQGTDHALVEIVSSAGLSDLSRTLFIQASPKAIMQICNVMASSNIQYAFITEYNS